MNTLYLITSILFLIWVTRNVLYWVYLWQLKEYRLDRIFIHLKDTFQGKNLLFSSLSLGKWAALFLFGLVIYDHSFNVWFRILVSILYVIQIFLFAKEVLIRTYKRPVLTKKAIAISVLSLGVIVISFAFPLVEEKFLWLLLLDRVTPLTVALFVFFFAIPTEYYRQYKVEQAVRKLRHHQQVLVIGVTGSYGKSSTKNYIADVLGKKFTVLRTRGTNNTPIGIANTILNDLKKDTEIFVVEMGAYKIGEIAHMCQMVQPKIGVLTAVNDQHISLFGSLENTKKAKYELIHALPKDGIGLFNGNNGNVYELFKNTSKNKILYLSIPKGSDIASETQQHADVLATHIVVKKESTTFEVKVKGKILHLQTPLLGAHSVENILPAVFLAKHLGMHDSDIKHAVSVLKPLEKTMVLHKLQNGVNLIEDTFNSNPAAVQAALEYMKVYHGKKILVLQPMIELGRNAKEDHRRVAKDIATVCDYLFLTNKNYFNSIEEGVKSVKKKCKVKIAKPGKITDFIRQNTKKDDIVVFEGKEAAFSFERMI